MKENLRKVLAILLAMILVVSISGCKSETQVEPAKEAGEEAEAQATDESAEAAGAEAEAVELEPVELSVGFWGAADKFGENDPVLDYVQEKFNVSFSSKGVSWSDYKEKYKLWAAADELPDIFAIDEFNTDTYNSWISQGVIQPLPSDLSNYPNIQKVMQQPDVTPLQVDGEFFMIPRLNYPSTDYWRYDRGVIMRKDWLENLGLEVPKTFEEYKTVLRAFVDEDPDGNGVADTIGITHKNIAMLDVFYLGTTPQLLNGAWVYEDGQWVPPFVASTTLDGIKQIKELYFDGLLDQDFAIMKNGDGQDKFAQGKTGVIAQQVGPGHLKELKTMWDKYDHDVDFADAIAIVYPWANAEGVQHSFVQTTFWSESYFNGKMSEVEMERTMMLYDWLLSPEWTEIKLYGIEGVDFEKDSDNYNILLEKNEDGVYVNLAEKYPSLAVLDSLAAWDGINFIADSGKNRATFGDDLMDLVNDFTDYSVANIEPMPTNFDVKLLPAEGKSVVAGISYSDDMLRIIMSDGDTDAEWAEALAEYEQYGLTDAINDVNEKVDALGIQ